MEDNYNVPYIICSPKYSKLLLEYYFLETVPAWMIVSAHLDDNFARYFKPLIFNSKPKFKLDISDNRDFAIRCY